MAKISAGILLYKNTPQGKAVFLVHPGGPFWKNKDLGSWSIPKGEISEEEDPLAAAIREFLEETGFELTGHFTPLQPVRIKSGKKILAWAHEGEVDSASIKSNTCNISWPPRSGKTLEIPEIDKGGYFTENEAMEKINEGQKPLLEEFYRNQKRP